MKDRIYTLGYDLVVLTIIGLAAFTGQVVANTLPIFGHTPITQRMEALEQSQKELEHSLDKKIGF